MSTAVPSSNSPVEAERESVMKLSLFVHMERTLPEESQEKLYQGDDRTL